MATTRFAPSPTGPLHLGHAYSAVRAQALAAAGGGSFRLRIDDIDEGRSRPEWRAAIDHDLAWLGLAVDGPPVVQSARLAAYMAARERLREAGLLYPCFCTRAAIAAEIAASASAPHGPAAGGADGPRYPGTCRHRDPVEAAERLAAGEDAAWRLDVEQAAALAGPLFWHDRNAGDVPCDPRAAGDVVLWRKGRGDDGGPAYHLASTVDDADMGITLVVRGRDLFDSTHIHRLLQALLGHPVPDYHHHRLIAGGDGRRLAKRDDSAALSSLREAGVDGRKLAADLRAGVLPPGYGWSD